MNRPSLPLAGLIPMAILMMGMTAAPPLANERSSPFEALRWNSDTPDVMIQSEWYRPLTIEGVGVDDVLLFCRQEYGDRARKRFGEDLPSVMAKMGHPLPASVALEVIRIRDEVRLTLPDIPSTTANRRAIWEANQQAREDPRGVDRRKDDGRITRREALSDLVEFRTRLNDQFAYRHLKDIDLDARLREIGSALSDEVEISDLAWRLHRLMMTFGDGHARVRSRHFPRAETFPPFLLEPTAEGIIAFRPDRRGFLDPARPYLVAIDGQPLSDLLDAMRPGIADGSPHLVRRRTLREVRSLESVRALLLDQPGRDRVTCTLATGPADPAPVELELIMTPNRPTYGDWPRRTSGLLENNLGYLRLPRMDDDLIPGIRASMDAFRDTDGLIIDVRGNGGGSRLPLLVLAGYLLEPGGDPWIGNVARYRTSERFGRNHLEARYVYRADDPRWTPRQRTVIEDFANGFTPEWDHPEGFSAWHYLVLDHTGADDEYHYDKPVIILSDSGCFSATDIFLGALAGRPGITLMGASSSGGSARSQRFRLPSSGIEIGCASMASFRPDGRLYDGRGVEVDVEVDSTPEYFLHRGRDRVLDAAVERLLREGPDPLP